MDSPIILSSSSSDDGEEITVVPVRLPVRRKLSPYLNTPYRTPYYRKPGSPKAIAPPRSNISKSIHRLGERSRRRIALRDSMLNVQVVLNRFREELMDALSEMNKIVDSDFESDKCKTRSLYSGSSSSSDDSGEFCLSSTSSEEVDDDINRFLRTPTSEDDKKIIQ